MMVGGSCNLHLMRSSFLRSVLRCPLSLLVLYRYKPRSAYCCEGFTFLPSCCSFIFAVHTQTARETLLLYSRTRKSSDVGWGLVLYGSTLLREPEEDRASVHNHVGLATIEGGSARLCTKIWPYVSGR